MTTPAVQELPQPVGIARPGERQPLRVAGDDAAAGPLPVAGGLRRVCVAVAAAWPPANAATTADTLAHGSSVGSTAAAQRYARTPFEGTAAEEIEQGLSAAYANR